MFYSNNFAQNFAQILPAYVKKETPQMLIPSSRSQESTTACYCWQGISLSYFCLSSSILCFYIKKKITFLLLEIKTFSGSYTDIPHPLQIQIDNKDLAFGGVAIIGHYYVNNTEESDDLCSCHPLNVWKQAG